MFEILDDSLMVVGVSGPFLSAFSYLPGKNTQIIFFENFLLSFFVFRTFFFFFLDGDDWIPQIDPFETESYAVLSVSILG